MAWGVRAGLAAGALLTILGFICVFEQRRTNPLAAILIAGGVIFTLATPVFFSIFIKSVIFYGQRYLSVALPFTILALAAGASGGGRRTAPLRAVLLLGLVVCQGIYLFHYYAHPQKHRWDKTAQTLTERFSPSDATAVVSDYDAGLLQYYLPAEWRVDAITPNALQIAGYLAKQSRPVTLVSFHDLRAALHQAGAGAPNWVAVVEAHRPAQELWITRYEPGARKK